MNFRQACLHGFPGRVRKVYTGVSARFRKSSRQREDAWLGKGKTPVSPSPAQASGMGGVPGLGAGQGVGRAGVEPVGGADGAALDAGVGADVEVEVDDGERAVPLRGVHAAEEGGRDDVQALEGPFVERALQACGTGLAGLLVDPPVQAHVAVHQEVARGLAAGHEQRGLGAGGFVVGPEAGEVGVGQDVGVVHQEGLVAVQPAAGVADAAAGVHQAVALVADVDAEAEIAVGAQEVDDLVSEVVDVDGDVVESGGGQLADDALQEGDAGHGHEGLGQAVGEGAQAGAHAGGEDEGFHRRGVSSWL